MLHLLEAQALGLWIDEEHNEKLQRHHAGEKVERKRCMMHCDHWENACNDRIRYPDRGRSHAQSFGPHACGNNFAEIDPDYRSL